MIVEDRGPFWYCWVVVALPLLAVVAVFPAVAAIDCSEVTLIGDTLGCSLPGMAGSQQQNQASRRSLG